MKLPFIDLHQDLILHIREREKIGQNKQTDFEIIQCSLGKIVVATAFPSPADNDYLNPTINDLIENDFREYQSFVSLNPGWKIITSAKDVQTVLQTKGLIGLVLHVEGLNAATPNDFFRLEKWFEMGWRSLGMVWNITNPLGGGTNDTTQGLTDFGRDMIQWLEKKHMIIDFAHMNAPTFWDAIKLVRGPVVVSHGNAQALCNSPRNYTDDQLRAVASTGGVVGVFFANTFLVGRGNQGSVVDVANQIDHFRSVMGIDHIALGTDFGGIISGTPTDLSSLEDLPTLWQELKKRKYFQKEIEQIAWKNVARVFTDILKS